MGLKIEPSHLLTSFGWTKSFRSMGHHSIPPIPKARKLDEAKGIQRKKMFSPSLSCPGVLILAYIFLSVRMEGVGGGFGGVLFEWGR